MKRLIIGALLCVGLIVAWIVLPVITYRKGTSDGVTSEVLREPFIESPVLVYRWSGTVTRSCPVDIRRIIIGSDGVVTTLIPKSFSAPPRSSLGKQTYEVRVEVPVNIAAGEAVYYPTEIPKCNWLQRVFPTSVEYPPVKFTVSR